MGKILTGNKDVDSIILQNLTDWELINVWLTGRYAYEIFNYDHFWRNRLKIKFPSFIEYKDKDMNFKRYYIYIVETISKFIKGEFRDEITQKILRKESQNKYNIFIWICERGYVEAAKYILEDKTAFPGTNLKKFLRQKYVDEGLKMGGLNGRLNVVKYLVEEGADVHMGRNYPVRVASRYGYFEIVKYLVEKGADKDKALEWASEMGNLFTVKYLVENGADVHTEKDCALRLASRNGYLELVKYLVENGANIHASNDYALKWAKKNKHLKIAEYLQGLP